MRPFSRLGDRGGNRAVRIAPQAFHRVLPLLDDISRRGLGGDVLPAAEEKGERKKNGRDVAVHLSAPESIVLKSNLSINTGHRSLFKSKFLLPKQRSHRAMARLRVKRRYRACEEFL